MLPARKDSDRVGHEVIVTNDGAQARAVLQEKDAPQLAILDWVMPEMDGVEVCRRVREKPEAAPTYILLHTAKGNKADIVEGLGAGANDYITKSLIAGTREDSVSRPVCEH